MRLGILILLLSATFAGAETVRSSQAVYQELHGFFPRAQIRLFDKSYENLSSDTFLNEFLPEYSKYLAEKNLRGIDAGFSEKHYAQLCKSQLQVWLIQRERRKLETESAILVTDAQARAAQPQLPSGWLLIKLDRQWQVFDAARMKLFPLEQFPYRSTVVSVQF